MGKEEGDEPAYKVQVHLHKGYSTQLSELLDSKEPPNFMASKVHYWKKLENAVH